MVGRHEVEPAVGESLPQRLAVGSRSQGRGDQAARAGQRIGLVVAVVGRASGSAGRSRRRREHQWPSRPRRVASPPRTRGGRRRRARRRPGRRPSRDESRPPRPPLTASRRGSAVPTSPRWSADATAASIRTGSSQWTSSMPPRSPSVRIASKIAAIVEPEVEDHEGLRRRDAGIDHRRQLGDRVVHPSEDRRT